MAPGASSSAKPGLPNVPQPSQPSDAIQKAMEATLASIELPPPLSQEASPAGPDRCVQESFPCSMSVFMVPGILTFG